MLDAACEPGGYSFIGTLRNATRSRHAKVAASPAIPRLFDVHNTNSEYRQHLGRHPGLFELLEQAVDHVTGPADRVRDLQLSGALLRELYRLKRYRGVESLQPAGAGFQLHGEGTGRSEALRASFCPDVEKTHKDNVPKICETAVAIFDACEKRLSAPLSPASGRP